MIQKLTKQEILDIKKLNSTSKFRSEKKLFVVEGRKIIQEIINKDSLSQLVNCLFVSEKFFSFNKDLIKEIEKKKINYKKIDNLSMNKISDTESPLGILCLMKQINWQKEKIINEANMILVLDGISDPGNLGTILRSAAAFGCDLILLIEDCVDLYNPKVIRSSAGSFLSLPVIKAKKNDILELKNRNFKIISFSPEAKIVFEQLDYNGKMVFLFGNESRGVNKELEKASDYSVKINISKEVESLNVAVACSVVLYRKSRIKN